MKNTNNFKFSIQTDLAIEATELIISSKQAQEQNDEFELDGIEVYEEEVNDNIKVTKVKITNQEGQKTTGKPQGEYITIESSIIRDGTEGQEDIISVLSKSLQELIKINFKQNDFFQKSSVLIVGLGNRNITPDALGPLVTSKVFVTRHLTQNFNDEIFKETRQVSAIAPGVTGTTGIETGEIIKGLCKTIKPDLVIAIDALAARKTERINSTIQMSDTGITPGAGVGNRRMVLNKETLGVPVIAIGVPTVVDAATLINDTMDKVLDEMTNKAQKGSAFYKMLKTLDKDEKYNLIYEILTPCDGNMFVTPKEVDAVIKRLANIISNGINIALHPNIINEENMGSYSN